MGMPQVINQQQPRITPIYPAKMGYGLLTQRSYVGGTLHATAEDMLLLIEGRFSWSHKRSGGNQLCSAFRDNRNLGRHVCLMETCNKVDH